MDICSDCVVSFRTWTDCGREVSVLSHVHISVGLTIVILAGTPVGHVVIFVILVGHLNFGYGYL